MKQLNTDQLKRLEIFKSKINAEIWNGVVMGLSYNELSEKLILLRKEYPEEERWYVEELCKYINDEEKAITNEN